MFRMMFSYSRRTGNRVGEGTKDSKPIILDGTTRKEFECLLSFLYDGLAVFPLFLPVFVSVADYMLHQCPGRLPNASRILALSFSHLLAV